ncbi:hypothetical protein Tco_1527080, partial [Tanacetum coccineum]
MESIDLIQRSTQASGYDPRKTSPEMS